MKKKEKRWQAAVLHVPELVPIMIPLLKDSQTRQQAIAALAGYEEPVIIIIPLLESYLVSKEDHLHLPRVLELIVLVRWIKSMESI